jgi:hypothetical protein
VEAQVEGHTMPQPKNVKRSEISFLDRPTKMLGQSGPTHWVGWVTQSAVRVCYRHNPTTTLVLQRCSLPQLTERHLWPQSPSPALVSAGVGATPAEIRAGRR